MDAAVAGCHAPWPRTGVKPCIQRRMFKELFRRQAQHAAIVTYAGLGRKDQSWSSVSKHLDRSISTTQWTLVAANEQLAALLIA